MGAGDISLLFTQPSPLLQKKNSPPPHSVIVTILLIKVARTELPGYSTRRDLTINICTLIIAQEDIVAIISCLRYRFLRL